MALIPAFIRRRIEHRPNFLKIVDNIGWLFFDKILRMGVGLLIGVWIARYLGPEQFGLLNFTAALIGLFGALAAMGLQGIVVRDIVRDQACREDTLGTAAALQLLGGTVAYSLLLATVFYLRPQDLLSQLVAAILGSVVLLKAFEVAAYWFESQVQSKYTVWVQNSAFLVFAGIKAVLILTGASLISFAWAMLAEAFVVALAMTLALHRLGLPLPSLRISYRRCGTLLKASWPLMLSSIAVMIYMKIDQIMIGQMLGNDAVGIYSAAVRISEIWYFIATAVAASVLPSILEAKKNNEAQYRQRLQGLFDLMTWLAVLGNHALWPRLQRGRQRVGHPCVGNRVCFPRCRWRQLVFGRKPATYQPTKNCSWCSGECGLKHPAHSFIRCGWCCMGHSDFLCGCSHAV